MSTQSDPVLQIRPDVTELRPAENGSLSQTRLETVDTSRPLLPLQGQSQRTLDIDGSEWSGCQSRNQFCERQPK